MSQLGQTEKNSVRANVVRFASELGHWATRSFPESVSLSSSILEGVMDDKEKSVVRKFVDTVTSVVGEAVTAAVMPTHDPEADKTDEQMMLRGDAAIAPEAVPAPTSPTAPKRANKRVAKVARILTAPAKKTKKAASKKSTKKASKKSAKKTVKKSKSAVKTTGKKAVKKKKSKR
jgi:hypothetical protein